MDLGLRSFGRGWPEPDIEATEIPQCSGVCARVCYRLGSPAPQRRFRTIQVYPKDRRALPGHPEPAVSWHSGFREGEPMLDTTRREFIALIGGGCLLLAVKVKRAWGQQPAMPVIHLGCASATLHRKRFRNSQRPERSWLCRGTKRSDGIPLGRRSA